MSRRALSADNVQTAMLLFSKYDTDGDGSISKEEIKAMLLRKCEDEGLSVDLSVVERQAILQQFSLKSLVQMCTHIRFFSTGFGGFF
jgi:hypothetical protein